MDFEKIINNLENAQENYDVMKEKFNLLSENLRQLKSWYESEELELKRALGRIETCFDIKKGKENELYFTIGEVKLFCKFIQYNIENGAILFGYIPINESTLINETITDHILFNCKGEIAKDISISQSQFIVYHFIPKLYDALNKYMTTLQKNIENIEKK